MFIRAEPALGYVALALIVFGARLWLISKFGSSMPIHDQWDGEARTLFKPFLDGTLRLADFFTAHNEHRIALSRLLALGLLNLNGQWDSLFEMTVNAAICAIIALFVSATLIRCFNGQHRIFILTGIAAWLGFPYANENTLWGFSSCFYFLLLFSWVAIWGLGFHKQFTVGWWSGIAALILACLSMASGFFAAIVLLGLITIRIVTRGTSLRNSWVTASLCAVVAILGFHFHITVQAHAILKATSPFAWLVSFGKCLSWPFCTVPFACLIIYAPLGILTVIYLFSKNDLDRAFRQRIEFLGTIGAWCVIQAAAIAYARGGDGSAAVSSRYMDILAIGTVVNLFALAVLSYDLLGHSVRRTVLIGTTIVVCLIVLLGSAQMSRIHVAPMTFRKSDLQDCEARVRAYITTGDSKYITDYRSLLPYPVLEHLIQILNEPTIRSILPATASAPLPVEKSEDGDGAFIPNGYPPTIHQSVPGKGWGSYAENGVTSRGKMLSSEINPRLPYLRFEIAGYFSNSMSLNLKGENNGHAIRIATPARGDGSWRPTYVSVPDTRVRIEAKDDDASQWIGFQEPQALGRFSYYSLRIIKQGKRIFVCGFSIWLLLIFHQGWRRAIFQRQHLGLGKSQIRSLM